ncbi:hypothetical protein H310_13616 [Aphanomyces invadans]|uniref:SET domain-containing protein n=1 Tax=Aphanomyces invadans TaxID=157072 RepID=A0A024TEG6_9STRA|nr:hypothetical protein H310_13616 [Aphanomyces invadans]ETV91976.1 hypothetical protein H310_13616 [Aphanomyces invadans]|eukprot:XP_008879400.1 hypothetical protein H310_13616 [Aphanomyces invadans]
MTLPTDALAVPEAPISCDLSKPLVATESLREGQVIFYETAFVSSTGPTLLEGHHEEVCDDEECEGCVEVSNLDENEMHQVSDDVVDDFDALMTYCETKEALEAVDVHKNLFKLLHLYELDSTSLRDLLHLPVADDPVPSFLDAAIGLRAAHPNVVPLGLSENDLAHLIGVVNKYSIPLDEIDSTGLFLYVSQLQHSCLPNACFTDAGDSLWVTAIAPIAAGEAVTVDFYNFYYQPWMERQAVLADAKCICHCDLCLGHLPDKTRAFKCVSCANGIVHPTKDVFACASCGAVWDNELVHKATGEEATLMEELEVFTAASLRQIMDASMLHAYHHIFYTTCSTLMSESIDETLTPEQALVVYQELLNSLNYVVTYPHASKLQLLNLMAQTCVGLGRIDTAKMHYEAAHAMSCRVFGSTCGESKMFLELAENTPTTVDEMAALYGFEDDDDEVDDDDRDNENDEESPDPLDRAQSSHSTIGNVW